MEKIYWTASNNSTFLTGRRSAKNMLAAVRAARKFLRGELYGEGNISYYDDPDYDMPIRTDEISMFTRWRWEIKTDF